MDDTIHKAYEEYFRLTTMCRVLLPHEEKRLKELEQQIFGRDPNIHPKEKES